VLINFIADLMQNDSPLIESLNIDPRDKRRDSLFFSLLRMVALFPLDQVVEMLPEAGPYLQKRAELHEFVESLYNYWRGFDRYLVCHSEQGPNSADTRPYRTFTDTVEQLTHIIRGVYRDVCENITGDHPRVYRQVPAGCQVGIIAVPKDWQGSYRQLHSIPFIRQIWIDPPMIIDPPMNTRTGQFKKVSENPIAGVELETEKWLCYPAQVGQLVVFVYFHQRFMGLGCALGNLFEMATDKQIADGPDAIYVYGAPPASLERFGDVPTVFFDDECAGPLVGAVPGEDRFGYFGYIKKMVLTLHNIVMMKRGRMPFHGAMTRIVLESGATANVLLIGDTATGKSETLEALRTLSKDQIRELRVVADDMGSLQVDGGAIRAYGTEIGAFVRLDDLQAGYAFGQIDRAIIMSPQRVNARVVIPITTLDEVLRGYKLDYILYANNYEDVDETHPVIERFTSEEKALEVFREGSAMAKGTTTSTGLMHSYFANIFGPAQYRELHEKLARDTFAAAFESGVYVAQLRTRLGIPGCESTGPEEAARALLAAVSTASIQVLE
jgi:energy-coupling factor transporter ATP-binding protein EcfA2